MTTDSTDIIRISIPLSYKDSRKLFEETHGGRMNLTRTEQGEYASAKTRSKWTGFRSIIRILHNHSTANKTAEQHQQFIVGLKVEDGTFQFGFRPKIHNTVERAADEATRLSAKYKKPFTVFEAITIVASQRTEVKEITVEESKQGEKGKKIESPYRVMTNWQERLKTIDLSKVSAPFSIMLTFEKKWLISYSSNEDSVVVDTYDDVLINISNWLIANKTESLSQ